MEQPKDHRLKYLELCSYYSSMATEIEISAKKHLRALESIGKRAAKYKAKTADDFERNELFKDFLITSHDINTKSLSLLNKIREMINEINADYRVLEQGAILRNKLADAQETIEKAMESRDAAIQMVYDLKKAEIGRQSI